MSSSTATSFSPLPQLQLQKHWIKPSKSHHKSALLTHFPPSFPSTLSLPSLNPKLCKKNSFSQPSLQSQVVLDSPEEELAEKIDGHLMDSVKKLKGRFFMHDPPWVNKLFMKGLNESTANGELRLEFNEIEREKYNLLRRRQIKAETEAWESMVEEYREFVRAMRENKLAPNLPQVKALILGWFEPFKKAIEKDQKLHRSRSQKTVYGFYVDMLPADKMAVIVMYKMMALMMAGNEFGCVKLIQAALEIGSSIELEIKIHGFLEKTKNIRKNAGEIPEELLKEKAIQRNRVKSLVKRKRLFEAAKLVTDEDSKSWSQDTQVKLGSRLIELLIDTAYVQRPTNQPVDCPPDIRPAFRHRLKILTNALGQQVVKRYGVIECDPLVLKGMDKSARYMVIPYVPMLIPPKNWKGYNNGGYLFLPSYVMRTHGSRKQQAAMRKTPPQKMQKVLEALNTLGNTKWRINRNVLGVVEALWASGGNIAGLVDCKDVPLPEKPLTEDQKEIEAWKWSVWRVKKLNRERHALRCDVELKLSVAQKMKDEEGFYYPHNLDFRGRAYPMHPHLNHLSTDLCKGVLEFAEGRPLGNSGLHWLQIHLANVYSGGIEKLSYEERVAFVENHLAEILDSARNPINGNRWWLTAEDPFQCLAACIDLSEALLSSSPHTFVSHLPLHQDGSCNGLQHYAALGRDSKEAAAVNLVAGEEPADVYSEIAFRVREIMEEDSRKDPEADPNAILAKALVDQVDRKLVKQTVMTSVYGVTFVGAQGQIKKRLVEKGIITDDRLLFSAACYSAKVTLSALDQLFQAARGIMNWLSDCAKVIASENQPVRWTTPLGLPVVQPYYKREQNLVKTSIQVLALLKDGERVEAKKQRTAFPPNYVHSLDGTHMMMTAVACRDAGLQFAGVHDSYWTHACDMDKMNQILREKFVELYNKPLLEDLLESFQTAYPASTFPPLPERGDFDLEEVLESPYFFN